MEISFKSCTISIFEKILFKKVDFSLQKGEFIRLKGRNGTGKTMFVNSLLGLHQSIEGEVFREFDKKEICYISENPFFFDNDRVSETLVTISFFYNQPLEKIKEVLNTMDFDVTEYLKKDISSLSKGMKKKIMLVPLFFESSRFLVLDEIFTGLDAVLQKKIEGVICEKSLQGTTILLIEHNESIVKNLKSKEIKLKEYLCQNQKIVSC